MSIFLKAELETDVVGDGDGFISLTQTLPDGEKVVIWLSLHQFEIIVEEQEHITKEALGLT
jgi:hypothetical protein